MWWYTRRNQISSLGRNGRVHLNRPGASVQSTTGSRAVLISGSNAGYTVFWGSVKGTGYPLHLNRWEGGGQFSRLLAAEVCASAVVMLDKPCSEVVWRVLATHCISQVPLHFLSRASPCAITFQLDSNFLLPNHESNLSFDTDVDNDIHVTFLATGTRVWKRLA